MLSVIIVNYHSISDMLQCLKSTFQFDSTKEMEWIIVNNDETMVTPIEIQNIYPQIKWINMGYNAGFARANNRGISIMTGDTALLLNPDTIIVDDAVAKCYQRLIVSENIGASVQLVNPDGSLQITGNFTMKGGLNHLLPLPYLGSLLRQIAFAFKVKKTHTLDGEKEQKVDWINGAFLMVKKSGIEKAGLLDEDFFLYAEEAEWCSRLLKVGSLVVYGDLHTIHLQGETVNRITNNKSKGYKDLTGRKGRQLMVSQHLRIRKEFGKGWFLFHFLMHTFSIPIFFIGSFIEDLFTLKNPFRQWSDALSFSKNVGTLWKHFFHIWSGRPYFYKFI